MPTANVVIYLNDAEYVKYIKHKEELNSEARKTFQARLRQFMSAIEEIEEEDKIDEIDRQVKEELELEKQEQEGDENGDETSST